MNEWMNEWWMNDEWIHEWERSALEPRWSELLWFLPPPLSPALTQNWLMKEKVSLIFFFSEIKSTWKKIAVFSKICEKLFSIGKKYDFKFQNRGYFGQKNMPQISWNFGHNYFTERWFTIFRQKISKTFLSGQKSNFKFQNRGYFGLKKYSANVLKLRS